VKEKDRSHSTVFVLVLVGCLSLGVDEEESFVHSNYKHYFEQILTSSLRYDLNMNASSSSSTMTLASTSVLDCGPPRSSSRSVSWNSTGFYLAVASSDRMARLYTIDHSNSTAAGSNVTDSNSTGTQQQQSTSGGGSAREVLVISGHTAPVTKVRFHPNEASTVRRKNNKQKRIIIADRP
jgi:WD40 repeat protein